VYGKKKAFCWHAYEFLLGYFFYAVCRPRSALGVSFLSGVGMCVGWGSGYWYGTLPHRHLNTQKGECKWRGPWTRPRVCPGRNTDFCARGRLW